MAVKVFFTHAWDVAARFLGGALAVWQGSSLRLLCLLMALDYASGLILALLGKSRKGTGRLSARESFLGLMRKGLMLGVILLAAALDQLSGQQGLLQRAATGFYICNEGISLLANAALLGVPVPRVLRRALDALGKEKNAAIADGN